jgi:hypothetical protein
VGDKDTTLEQAAEAERVARNAELDAAEDLAREAARLAPEAQRQE